MIQIWIISTMTVSVWLPQIEVSGIINQLPYLPETAGGVLPKYQRVIDIRFNNVPAKPGLKW
ncbi:protein of unknown function [Xenorhabdus poinarii G6]|uniref:Uncharacterized protein n=1 Tax=Xenorhabdus poinarii G6 TaxID=1354304 RepID=A0A068R3Y7_9GAMM|nr:hypothetical protein [Xenorhabdus poinarii]CDG21631.1 protein of unknown function [Xenorhabdus poinarii G6]